MHAPPSRQAKNTALHASFVTYPYLDKIVTIEHKYAPPAPHGHLRIPIRQKNGRRLRTHLKRRPNLRESPHRPRNCGLVRFIRFPESLQPLAALPESGSAWS